MVRFLAQSTLSLIANAVGLIMASALLDGLSIDTLSFIIAVLIFTVSTMLLGPFVASMAEKYASFLVGGIALVTTFVGLLITTIFSNGISIDGLDTWVVATFIVWLFSVIANVLLPLVLFKKALGNIKEGKE
jgi:uncharacterized membrane protein YvlD (DUF360 family)